MLFTVTLRATPVHIRLIRFGVAVWLISPLSPLSPLPLCLCLCLFSQPHLLGLRVIDRRRLPPLQRGEMRVVVARVLNSVFTTRDR